MSIYEDVCVGKGGQVRYMLNEREMSGMVLYTFIYLSGESGEREPEERKRSYPK